jgi:NAD(P)H-flavin reductase
MTIAPIARARAEADPWTPVHYRVGASHRETADTATLVLLPRSEPITPFRPGQFAMLYVLGVGEIPISISGDPAEEDVLELTIRGVGAVSEALRHAPAGTPVGVRGPFGTGWRLDVPAGADLLLVAGGIGLAPLRPALRHALANRRRYGRIVLVAGARTPAELLFTTELVALAKRADVELVVTVDRASEDWTGRVGLVTEPLAEIDLFPEWTAALLCGPEPMMRFSAKVLLDRGMPAERIQVSLERNMKCGIGLCGHCQLGPLLLCRDGPVVPYPVAAPLLEVREL